MATAHEAKSGIINAHQRHEMDTGSAEVQIALLTSRITELTNHLQSNLKDHAARRGLLKMVGRRSKLQRYLMQTDRNRYRKVVAALGLRK